MTRMQLGMMCAAIFSIQELGAQCGRCGDGGGTSRPPGYVVRNSFRTTRPVPLPNSTAGGGTLTAGVTVRDQLLQGTSAPIGSVEVALTSRGVGPATVTAIEFRKTDKDSPQGSVLLANVTLGVSFVSIAGSGTLRRQGQLIQGPDPVDPRSADYFARVQIDNGDWVELPLVPAQSEFVAIAALQPIDSSQDLGSQGTGVFSATVARTASGSIASAEVRFDVQYRLSSIPIGGAPSLRSIGLVSGRQIAKDDPVYALNANTTNQGPMPQRALLPTIVRQLSATDNQAELRALEVIIGNPGSHFFHIETDRPAYDLGGQLELTVVRRVSLTGNSFAGATGRADGLVEAHVLRRPGTGEIVGGYATFEWLYRDMTVGDTVNAIKPFLDVTEIKEFAPASERPTENYWLFNDALTDRTIREPVGGLSMRMPLLADSLSLRVLLEAKLAGILITSAFANGAVQFSSVDLGDLDVGPFIRKIEPAITTPGSWITVYGGGFTERSQVVIGGFGAAEVRVLDSARVLARIAPDTPTLPLTEKPVVVIDSIGRTSNNVRVLVDVVEPYIVSDADGGASIINQANLTPVRADTPLSLKDTAEIRVTGITASADNPRTMDEHITVTVKIEGVEEVVATVGQDVDALGYWRVQFQVPERLPDPVNGRYTLTVIGTWRGENTGTRTPFPSNIVDVWVRR